MEDRVVERVEKYRYFRWKITDSKLGKLSEQRQGSMVTDRFFFSSKITLKREKDYLTRDRLRRKGGTYRRKYVEVTIIGERLVFTLESSPRTRTPITLGQDSRLHHRGVDRLPDGSK